MDPVLDNSIILIDKLYNEHNLTFDEWHYLISNRNDGSASYLTKRSVFLRKKYYSDKVFLRGLIEFTNHCKNDCLYCGIRRSNTACKRYRLSEEEIVSCCKNGYNLGYRTFVLQSGEDAFFTPQKIADIVFKIKTLFPDCAVTLSVGEHSKAVYKLWFDSGADRYLLRHETADESHYKFLHPDEMSFSNRIRCLYDLKEIGYQVGCGFMTGSPGQTAAALSKDMLFISEIKPDMVGIGPFIPQKDTPFNGKAAGSLKLTLFMLSLIRLTLPKVLLPSTTALGTISPSGRELGILSGANVCMPNLSPINAKEKYTLYDNKIYTGTEDAEHIDDLSKKLNDIGYKIEMSKGDRLGFVRTSAFDPA